jgi:hypothetical protein
MSSLDGFHFVGNVESRLTSSLNACGDNRRHANRPVADNDGLMRSNVCFSEHALHHHHCS